MRGDVKWEGSLFLGWCQIKNKLGLGEEEILFKKTIAIGSQHLKDKTKRAFFFFFNREK